MSSRFNHSFTILAFIIFVPFGHCNAESSMTGYDGSRADDYQYNGEDCSISIVTVVVIAIVSFVLGICTASAIFYFLYKYKSSRSNLSDAEKESFKLKPMTGVANETYEEEPYDKAYEIPFEDLEIQRDQVLGQGTFGIVYKGFTGLTNSDEYCEPVAIKTQQEETYMDERAQTHKMLMNEIKMLIYIGQHPNIIRLVGACTTFVRQEKVVYVVLELCSKGTLDNLLRKSKHATELSDTISDYANLPEDNEEPLMLITDKMMCDWSLQIAQGMEFLEQKKVVHGDVALRNILVASDMSIRIFDFGNARRLEGDDSFYSTYDEQIPLPWRWLAPECLESMKFSTASDVWAFGITLWEIYSMGTRPFEGYSWDNEFVSKLKSGERPAQPAHASDKMYSKMQECWALEPSERPKFSELVPFFED